jgi:hypothetical protein
MAVDVIEPQVIHVIAVRLGIAVDAFAVDRGVISR